MFVFVFVLCICICQPAGGTCQGCRWGAMQDARREKPSCLFETYSPTVLGWRASLVSSDPGKQTRMMFQTLFAWVLSSLKQEVNMMLAWPSPQQRNLKPEFHFTTLHTPTQRTYLDNQRIFPVDVSLVSFKVKVPVEDSELVVGEGLQLVSKV